MATKSKEVLTLKECDNASLRLKHNKSELCKNLKLTKEEVNKLLEITSTILCFNEPIKVYTKLDVAAKLALKCFVNIESDGKFSMNKKTMEIWDFYQNIN